MMNTPLTYWVYSWGPTFLYLFIFVLMIVWMNRLQSKRWAKFFETAAKSDEKNALLVEQNKQMVARLGEIKSLLEDRNA
jgi:hypothetical protein